MMGWFMFYLLLVGIGCYATLAYFPISTVILLFLLAALVGGIVYMMHDFRVW